MKTQFPALVVVALMFVGCQRGADTDSGSADGDVVVMDGPPPESVHDHPEHGPHGGELIELGQETYHGEPMHDDKNVTIYVLDGGATQTVPIEATTLTVSLKHDGAVQTFDLNASPDEGDADGKSSRFTSDDSTLCEWMEHDAEGAVMIEIEGKSFTGEISHHDHDHDH